MPLKKSQRSLKSWTKQKWRTKSGKKSSETGERYLPEKAIKALSPQEYAATTRAKRKGTKAGKQFVNSKVRLYGIDTPESRTRDEDEKVRGLLAKEYLSNKISSAKQLVIQTEKDAKGKFGRVLGRLFADKININQSMIDNYLAVEYYGQSKEELNKAHMANRRTLINQKKINLDL